MFIEPSCLKRIRIMFVCAFLAVVDILDMFCWHGQYLFRCLSCSCDWMVPPMDNDSSFLLTLCVSDVHSLSSQNMLRSVVSNSIRRTNAAGTTKNNGLFLCRGGRMRHLPPLCHYDNKALGYHCASSLASQTNQNMSTASSNDKRLTWQAEHNVDIQRVTQRAIVS
jgi:hypothetical protein